MESSSHNEFSFFKLNFKKSKFNNFRTLFEINKRFLVERFGRTLELLEKTKRNPDEIEVNDMALDIISSTICGPTKILLSDPENIRLLLLAIIKQQKRPKTTEKAKKIYDIVIKNFENILDKCDDGSFIDKFPTFKYPDDSSPEYQSAWRLPTVCFETGEYDDNVSWQEQLYDYMDEYFKYIQKLYNKVELSEEENTKAYQNYSCLMTLIKCGFHDKYLKFKYMATQYGEGKNKDNSIGMYLNQIGDDGKILITNDKRFLISFEKIHTIRSHGSGDNLSFIQDVFLYAVE